MDNGSIIPAMDMYGCLPLFLPVSDLMLPEGIGCILLTGGTGFRIIPGDGLHSIMGTGFMMTAMAGCGFLVTTGLPPGLHGVNMKIIIAGPQSDPGWKSGFHLLHTGRHHIAGLLLHGNILRA